MAINFMSKPEEQKLREEWSKRVDDDSNDKMGGWGFVMLSEDEKSIADWWLNKMKEQREKMIESISEDITNYDEVYISEDVRKAINRMKFNLKSIIKNKE